MAVKIAPDARRQFINASGVPYSGAKLFYYAAGSTTKQNTYTTSVGNIANSNPIVLDSAGRTPYGVWFTAGLSYKEVLAPSTDTDPPGSPIYTEDNLSGVNDTSVTVSQWAASSLTPTYISTTSFSVPGDQTTELHVGRRLQFTVTAGTVYGRISASVYGALTTVTVVMDSGQTLDSGLTSFNWSILTATNPAIPKLSITALSDVGIANTTDYALLAGPTFTGTPDSPTAAVDTNTTQIATTAFVLAQAASATPLTEAATAVVGTSKRYARADHVHPQRWMAVASPVMTTSGTSVALTPSVPSWVRRITLCFSGVSTNGTAGMSIQIGTSGGLETTGYVASGSSILSTVATSTSTTGFIIKSSSASASLSGVFVLQLYDSNDFGWVCSHTLRESSTGSVLSGAGDKTLSAALTRVSAVSTDTFDAGAISVTWE